MQEARNLDVGPGSKLLFCGCLYSQAYLRTGQRRTGVWDVRITRTDYNRHGVYMNNPSKCGRVQQSASVQAQSGVGLIEILIAVLLISIGFLAAAQMQVQGMRNSRSSYHQSQAHLLANDIIDRMRINFDGVTSGFYDDLSTSAAATNPHCSTKVCNNNELAQQDLFDWSANLHPLNGESNFIPVLPSSDKIPAQGTVTPSAQGGYEVTIVWGDSINGGESKQSLTMNFVPEATE